MAFKRFQHDKGWIGKKDLRIFLWLQKRGKQTGAEDGGNLDTKWPSKVKIKIFRLLP